MRWKRKATAQSSPVASKILLFILLIIFKTLGIHYEVYELLLCKMYNVKHIWHRYNQFTQISDNSLVTPECEISDAHVKEEQQWNAGIKKLTFLQEWRAQIQDLVLLHLPLLTLLLMTQTQVHPSSFYQSHHQQLPPTINWLLNELMN